MKWPYILPSVIDLLDVSKEILPLTRCPTVGALVFRYVEQPAVKQFRQGEVLRMNRNHLLTPLHIYQPVGF